MSNWKFDWDATIGSIPFDPHVQNFVFIEGTVEDIPVRWMDKARELSGDMAMLNFNQFTGLKHLGDCSVIWIFLTPSDYSKMADNVYSVIEECTSIIIDKMYSVNADNIYHWIFMDKEDRFSPSLKIKLTLGNRHTSDQYEYLKKAIPRIYVDYNDNGQVLPATAKFGEIDMIHLTKKTTETLINNYVVAVHTLNTLEYALKMCMKPDAFESGTEILRLPLWKIEEHFRVSALPIIMPADWRGQMLSQDIPIEIFRILGGRMPLVVRLGTVISTKFLSQCEADGHDVIDMAMKSDNEYSGLIYHFLDEPQLDIRDIEIILMRIIENSAYILSSKDNEKDRIINILANVTSVFIFKDNKCFMFEPLEKQQ